MIEIKNVTKSFGATVALEDATLTVEDGAVLGLVGINGAGKSTLLRLVSGVLKPDSGGVFIDGKPVFENVEVKKQFFFLPDDPYFSAGLTAEAQAEFYKNFYAFDPAIFAKYVQIFKFAPNKPLRNFSKGMRRQAFVSLALACSPRYLLLDEAFDGLDPLARLEFKRGIIDLQQSGSTIIVSSHSLRELEDICDSFALLDGRRVKACGKIDGELGKIAKFQLVFAGDVNREDLPFECLHFEKTGRVIRIVVKGDLDDIRAQLEKMQPLVMDEIPADFEDMFIYEAGERGFTE